MRGPDLNPQQLQEMENNKDKKIAHLRAKLNAIEIENLDKTLAALAWHNFLRRLSNGQPEESGLPILIDELEQYQNQERKKNTRHLLIAASSNQTSLRDKEIQPYIDEAVAELTAYQQRRLHPVESARTEDLPKLLTQLNNNPKLYLWDGLPNREEGVLTLKKEINQKLPYVHYILGILINFEDLHLDTSETRQIKEELFCFKRQLQKIEQAKDENVHAQYYQYKNLQEKFIKLEEKIYKVLKKHSGQ